MPIARVISIHRYPVKSMAGETLERVRLTERGVPGDRAWAVRDERRGGIRGAKQLPGLMRCRARYLAEPPETGSGRAEITLADGARVWTDDPGADARLSASLEHPVTLWPLQPADDLDHYRRAPIEGDVETELRAVFGRTADEPLPDLSRFPRDLFVYESPPGTYFDAYPLLLLTEASLRRMQRLAPGSAFDVRRFRPNLVLASEGTDDAFPELEWRGRKLRVGGAVLSVTIECPRCVMVTHPQAELPKDPAIMRALVREAGGALGVYASVEEPGPVAVGDAALVL
jgi:uncharacterized protein YcbX